MLATVEAQSKPVAQEMEPYAQNWYEDLCDYRLQYSGERNHLFDVLFNRFDTHKCSEYLRLTKNLPLSIKQGVSFMRLSSDLTQELIETKEYFKELAFEGQTLRTHLPSFYNPENIENAMLIEANQQAHEAIRNRNSILRNRALCPEAYNELVNRISYKDDTITVKGINVHQPLNPDQTLNPGPTFSVKYNKHTGQMCVDDPFRYIIDDRLARPINVARNLAYLKAFELTDKAQGIILQPEQYHTEHSVLKMFIDRPFTKIPQMLKQDIGSLRDEDAIRIMQCFFTEYFRQATTIATALVEIDKLSDQELKERLKYVMPFEDLLSKAKQSNQFSRLLAADSIEGIASAYILYGPSIQEWADTHNGRYPQRSSDHIDFEGYNRPPSSPWNINP